MYFRGLLVSVASLVVLSCGGGGSGGGSSSGDAVQPPEVALGCPQHSEFFSQLASERTGVIQNAECVFDVTLTLNNDPEGQLCTITGSISYTPQQALLPNSAVCFLEENAAVTALIAEPISFHTRSI